MENTNPYIGDQQKTILRSKIRELLTKRKDPNYVRAYLYEVEGLDLETIDTELDTIQNISNPQYKSQGSGLGSANIGGKEYQFKTLQEALSYQEFEQKKQKEQQIFKAENETKKAYLQNLNEKLTAANEILADESGLKASAGSVRLQMPFSKTKQRFVGNLESLLDISTLDQLIEAKNRGATFGALSNEELMMLRNSASRATQWAIKDESGKVIGYDIDEETLKKEIQRLSAGWDRVRGEIQTSILPDEEPQMQQQPQISESDAQGAEKILLWLQENPNDPRVGQVKELLQSKGIQIPTAQAGMEPMEEEVMARDEKKGFFSNIAEDTAKRLKNVFSIIGGKRTTTGEDINTLPQERIVQSLGQVAGLAGDVIANAFGAGFSAIDEASGGAFSSGLEELAKTEAGRKGLEALSQGMESYNAWAEKNPRLAQNVEAVGNILSVAPIGKGAQLGARGARGVAKETAEMAGRVGTATAERIGGAVTKIGENVPETLKGVKRYGEEVASRVPRFFTQRAEDLKDAAKREDFIQSAPLVQQKALKDAFNAELDEGLILAAKDADEATNALQKKMVQMAESKKNPGIVAGDAALEQFELIQKRTKEIGEEIGRIEKSLPNKNINIKSSVEEFARILDENEISLEKGKLVAPTLTPAQKTAVKQLMTMIKERGYSLTPQQIHKFDQVLSTLQRESRMNKVADISVTVNGERKGLFTALRDIYRNELDKITSFRDVNNEYRKFRTLEDDLEKTIFKAGGNVESIDKDFAEFAKTNMRRIFGEAQSSETYREMVQLMDETARGLGYEGADPANLVEFAESLRRLYPETIPKTGFQGGIQTGVGAALSGQSSVIKMADTVISAGKARERDQINALKKLLGL